MILKSIYRAVGVARNLRASRITTTNAMVIATSPGRPASSAKPEVGNAVDVGRKVTVSCACAAWVNAAATVAVCGSEVEAAPVARVPVGEACATGGVFVAVRVAVARGVCESISDCANAVMV